MHFRKYVDLYIGLFFLLFSIVYSLQISSIRLTRVSVINSAMYPKWLAALLICLSLAQVLIALRQLKKGYIPEENQAKKNYKGAGQTLFLALAYVVVIETLGFLVSSSLYIFLQILIMCPPEKIRYAQFGSIAVVASGIIYVIFRYGLDLMLPLGFFEQLLH